MFVPGQFIPVSLIFESKAGAYPSEPPYSDLAKGKLQALLASIMIALKTSQGQTLQLICLIECIIKVVRVVISSVP